jgi:tripartite-type tricarboxylate transporter receptor subunit TctC
MQTISMESAALLAALAAGFGAALYPQPAAAQTYPVKPVRVLVGNAPGSLNDNVARIVFTRVGEALGQQFIIDNRAGAGGIIAAEVTAKAPADGYTLLNAGSTNVALAPFLYAKVGYDPLRDFDAVSLLTRVSDVLVVHPSLGVKTLPDFVALAKARPKQIAYASGGNGHPTHLVMELFQRKAGISLVHVPYKGTSPGVQAVVAGEVSAFSISIGLVRPHLAAGRLIAIAKTGFASKDMLPGLPALTQFYPDAEYIPWQGVFAPKGTPKEIVARLNAEIGKALATPDVRSRLTDFDVIVSGSTPAELDKLLRDAVKVNSELIRSIGLKAD